LIAGEGGFQRGRSTADGGIEDEFETGRAARTALWDKAPHHWGGMRMKVDLR
jgi:hypothetical protein